MNPSLSVGDLNLGDSARVRDVGGGRSIQQRMSMLGIRRGIDISVVHGPSKRGAVLQVGGARVALGWGIIQHIEVELPGTDSRNTGEPT
ncbi:FeoA family protein [Acidithiobacillus sp.]|uniref:FeoA family protein n=1 Tax=Acidithiobacillus sp. TaxID=1872118 RepID=UPI0025BDA6C8|nr:FeoA family protein [Acidithiobacillus sp.]MCK9189548.1 ferrous iron transport protein A [Acidithiobacillus sp.]MCK9359129.1 ferrous iron transport protein A [Acidithiobacillus sp.]